MKEIYDINYAIIDLMFEMVIEKTITKMEIHNETLRNMAIIAEEKTCKQVRMEGPALFVVDLNLETGEETI